MSEKPIIPAWFAERFARWGDLTMEWEPWRLPRDTAMPVFGLAFYRWEGRSGILFRYILPGRPEAMDWFAPLPDARSSHRYVVRDLVRGERVKVFDCVDDEGRLVPPGQGILDALETRYDAWDETFNRLDQEEEAHQDEDGTYVSADSMKLRKEAEDKLHDPLVKAAEQAGGVVKVPLYDPPPKVNGITVVDKRRFAHLAAED